MAKTFFKKPKVFLLIGAWLALTVSLTLWWMIFGLKQIERLAAINHTLPEEIIKAQRMLHWEGSFLVALLVIGGIALFNFSRREQRRHNQMSEFFATMTHELKTPLASLRLQIECLQEDLQNTEHAVLIERLLKDSARLEVQLENALFLAGVKSAEQLHLETLKLKPILSHLQNQWPELKIEVSGDCHVKADVRALEGVLKNIIHNARIHGKATQVVVAAQSHDHKINLTIQDNGTGFLGNTDKLGELFTRHTPSSGSGVGLYLAKKLVEKMDGDIEFHSSPKGFTAQIVLQGGSH
ncbi:MAG: HAMP domain-containing sensor histidine kinase [Oligoflexia bacterium]|nr:HAMP domain-containing sensor histidine kinase [Oligoflexia bacterium]